MSKSPRNSRASARFEHRHRKRRDDEGGPERAVLPEGGPEHLQRPRGWFGDGGAQFGGGGSSGREAFGGWLLPAHHAQQDGPAHHQPRFAEGTALRIRDGRPEFGRDQPEDVLWILQGPLQKLVQKAPGLVAARGAAGLHKPGNEADRRVERAIAEPERILLRCAKQSVDRVLAGPDRPQALRQRVAELGRGCPVPPVRSGDARLVPQQFAQQLARRQEASPERGIHHLQPTAMLAPQHDEMRRAIGLPRHRERRHFACVAQQQMVGRHHALLDREPQASAVASIASIEVPSMSVWQASRKRRSSPEC